jgi:hypothetical protein
MVLTPGEIIVPHPRGTPHTVYNHFVLSQLDGCDVTKYLMVGTRKLLNTVMHQIQPQIPTELRWRYLFYLNILEPCNLKCGSLSSRDTLQNLRFLGHFPALWNQTLHLTN